MWIFQSKPVKKGGPSLRYSISNIKICCFTDENGKRVCLRGRGRAWSMDGWMFFDKLCAIYLKIEPAYKVTINLWIYIYIYIKQFRFYNAFANANRSIIRSFLLYLSSLSRDCTNWNFLFIFNHDSSVIFYDVILPSVKLFQFQYLYKYTKYTKIFLPIRQSRRRFYYFQEKYHR